MSGIFDKIGGVAQTVSCLFLMLIVYMSSGQQMSVTAMVLLVLSALSALSGVFKFITAPKMRPC